MYNYSKKSNISSSPHDKKKGRSSFEFGGKILKKKSLFDVELDTNTNIKKISIPKKRTSQISTYKISDNELSEESNYISNYIRNNLNIQPKKKKDKKIPKTEKKLNTFLGNSNFPSLIISNPNKETDIPHFTKIFKKNLFHSHIIGKKKIINSLNISNSFSPLNKLEKSVSLNIEKKKSPNLYYKLISENFCSDISNDIINKYGGYRTLFRQRKLSDSEESDDIVIIIDSFEKYIIHPANNYFVIFKCIIFILMFYLIIIYPLSFAFLYKIPLFIHIFIDFIFIIDFFVGFFIGFFDDEGKMVKNLKLCVYNFLTKNFLKNLIISFPFLSICHNSNSFLKILPLIRILKFYEFTYDERDSELFYDKLIINLHIIKSLSVHNPFYSFLEFFAGFFILLHISSCIFVFLLTSDYPNWTTTNFDDSNNTNYIAGFYFSLTTIITVGYGDVTAVSYNERLYSIVLMILGVCLYSCVLSILSSLFEDFQTKEKNNKKNIYLLDEIRSKYHIPNEIYHKVLRYLKYTSVINSKDNNLLMDSLPKYYKSALLYEIHGESLNNLNFFKGKSNEFKFTAVLFLKELNLIKGEFLIQAGEIVEEFYMVKKGILQIQKETNFEKNIKILKIREKEHFGEIYMTSGLPMPFDIAGYSKFCELFYFKKSDFILLYEHFPKEIEQILHLSWQNTIRIEIKAKMEFEKAESQNNLNNITFMSSLNENHVSHKEKKNLNNKLTVINEEFTPHSKTNINEENENLTFSIKNQDNNKRSNINLIDLKNDNNKNIELNFSNDNNFNSMNFSNETQTRNSSLVNVSLFKKKGTIFGTTVHSKMSIPADLKVKERRASTPIKDKSTLTDKNKDNNEGNNSNDKEYTNFVKNAEKNSFFRLPLINFIPEEKEKNKTYSDKNDKNSERLKNKTIKPKINNYNVNLNVNIQNNFNSQNDLRVIEKNEEQKKKETIGMLIQNLKGLSEKLKNPTNFFRNYGTNNISSFKPFNKSDDNLRKYSFINNSKMKQNMIINMNKQIEKIDFIYEKIIVSLLEKYIKKNKPYK